MAGFKGQFKLLIALSLYCILNSSSILAAQSPKPLTIALSTSYGANLDKENRQSSFTFTPEVNYPTDPKTHLNFSTVIDRPTNPYSQFQIPTVSVSGIKELSPRGEINPQVSLTFSALSLDKLETEGLSVRTRPAIGISIQPFSFLTLSGRMGPYLVLSQYRQFAHGAPKPRYGINELLAAEFTISSWKLEIEWILDQAYTSFWNNNYSSSESIQYLFSSSVSLGISHSLLSSIIDDSTGFYRSVQAFDDRNSRLSLFLNVNL